MRLVRAAYRSLRGTPVFSGVVAITLGVGVAATALSFLVLEPALLRGLPFPDDGNLYRVVLEVDGNSRLPDPDLVPLRLLTDWPASSDMVAGSAGYWLVDDRIEVAGRPLKVDGAAVSPLYFEMLGMKPHLGRFLNPSDAGSASVVVVSFALWVERLGADPSVVGRSVEFADGARTVVGVAPSSLTLPQPGTDYWIPIAAERAIAPGTFALGLVRLKPGVSRARAEAEATSKLGGLRAEAPVIGEGAKARLLSLRDELLGTTAQTLLYLHAVLAVLLVLIAVNVSGLAAARTAVRLPDLAIRSALGARRSELAILLTVEVLLLNLAAAAIATGFVLVGWGGMQRLTASVPHLPPVEWNWRVGGVLASVAGASVILCAWRPLRWLFGSGYAAIHEAISAGGRVRGTGPAPLRHRPVTLMTFEIAGSVALLSVAVLLLATLIDWRSVDRGYDPGNLAFAEVEYSRSMPVGERLPLLISATAGLSRISGIESFALTNRAPWETASFRTTLGSSESPDGDADVGVGVRVVSEGFLDAMGMRLVRGRWLGRAGTGERRVCVLSESAMRSTCGEIAVGDFVDLFGDEPFEVVGVVGDAFDPGFDPGAKPEVFILAAQAPAPLFSVLLNSPHVLVRTTPDAGERGVTILHGVLRGQEDLTVIRSGPATGVMTSATRNLRIRTGVAGILAVVGLVLASTGASSTLLMFASSRRREFGVRVALGASRWRAILALGGPTVRAFLAGGSIGVLTAWAALGILRSQVPAFHAGTFVFASGAAVAVTMGAAFVAMAFAARGLCRSSITKLLAA